MDKLFEKLGIFYLGENLDPDTMEPTGEPTLLESKALTTHAAIIGMTGSGKTGLGIDLLEEAAIDNIPVIVIDPKGDMGDLCLAFDDLSADAFLPWVEEEARQKGEEPHAYAEKIAKMWREGIESFGQSTERIRRFKEHDATIYTPGSDAGVPVNVLGSLDAPDEAIRKDSDALASVLQSTVASLLALLGLEADPLQSREFILVAQILKQAWLKGETLDMGGLVSRIIDPPFSKVGVLPLQSFYPPAERFKLASRFNNVLASPTFENWLKGDPLRIDSLMYDARQRSKISIFSIAHLGDRERMFFVTLLLNRILGWMRRQSGTGRLRALVYMDEIYGYFPPSKNPPSKAPMMLLLKQARAFGVGMVLSTQNPVDLDYKGLSNIGTWIVGRLQTRQDIEKVVDGLAGKLEDSMEKSRIAELLRVLPKRTFFLKSTHLPSTLLFRTRWVLSYLKGPLKKREIARLMAPKKTEKSTAQSPSAPTFTAAVSASEKRPILSSRIPQRFDVPAHEGGTYLPELIFAATVRYFNAARGIDIVEEACLSVPLDASQRNFDPEAGEPCDPGAFGAPDIPATGCSFAELPEWLAAAKSLRPFVEAYSDRLYATRRLELYRCRPLRMESEPGESREAFENRLMEELEERKSEEARKLQERYERKLRTLSDRLQRAMQRLQKEQEDVQAQTTGSVVDVGLAIFGALFGSKRSAASKVGQAIKGGKRILKEKADVHRAEERVEAIEAQIEELKEELEEKLDILEERFSLERYEIETFYIKPRRSDICVTEGVLFWRCETSRRV